MPVSPGTTDEFEVTFSWTIAGGSREADSVFGVIDNLATRGPIDICEAIEGTVSATILQAVCGETVLTRVSAEDGAGNIASLETTHAGGASGDQAPPNVTYLIKKLTGLSGRRNQGRMYLPGPPEGAITAGGSLSGPGRAAAQDAVNDWVAALDGVDLGLILLHSDSSVATSIYALSVESKVATQRRRLRS